MGEQRALSAGGISAGILTLTLSSTKLGTKPNFHKLLT